MFMAGWGKIFHARRMRLKEAGSCLLKLSHYLLSTMVDNKAGRLLTKGDKSGLDGKYKIGVLLRVTIV